MTGVAPGELLCSDVFVGPAVVPPLLAGALLEGGSAANVGAADEVGLAPGPAFTVAAGALLFAEKVDGAFAAADAGGEFSDDGLELNGGAPCAEAGAVAEVPVGTPLEDCCAAALFAELIGLSVGACTDVAAVGGGAKLAGVEFALDELPELCDGGGATFNGDMLLAADASVEFAEGGAPACEFAALGGGPLFAFDWLSELPLLLLVFDAEALAEVGAVWLD